MNLVRCEYENKVSYGLLKGRKVELLKGEDLGDLQSAHKTVSLDEVRLLAPCQPTKIICVGLNYYDHIAEVNAEVPSAPVIFLKPSSTVIGPNDSIVLPGLSNHVDFEAELAIVIKQEAKHISEKEAPAYILGYTCANDVSARDLQPADGQWTIAKSFDTFLPLGPSITDEIDPLNCDIWARQNGEIRQQSNTKHLIFKPSYLVSYLSQVMTLYAGDVIITGTPSGSRSIAQGDRIEIGIDGIGTLSNPVA